VPQPVHGSPAVVLPLTSASPLSAHWLFELLADIRLLLVMVQSSVRLEWMVFVESGPVFVIVCAEASPVKPKQAMIAETAQVGARRSSAVLTILPSLLSPIFSMPHYKSRSLYLLYNFLHKKYYSVPSPFSVC
jgi:hypothetical protein